MITVREATVGDLEHLTALGVRFILSTPAYARLMRPDPGRIYSLLTIAIDHGVIFVAEVDGYVVGGIALVVMPNPISGEPTADEIAWFVAPEHRSSSVGPRLLVAAENWCATNGATTIKMIAPAGSAVRHYYARRGYIEVETAYAKKVQAHGMVESVRLDARGPAETRAVRRARRAARRRGRVTADRAAAGPWPGADDGPATERPTTDRDESGE